MRQILVLLALTLSAESAQASCPAEACYAVTFKVLACQPQAPVVVAPNTEPFPEGVLLKAEKVVARPVPCHLGAEHWKASGIPEIQNESSFFYRSAGYEKFVCGDLKGRTVTLFAPAQCCDTPDSCALTPARELIPLPLSAQ